MTQVSGAVHVVHLAPPVPQVVLPLGWQVPTLPGPLEQHPVGQVVALQMHPVPLALQVVPAGHVPQLPPQPFGPQILPWQFGWQVQAPLTHVFGEVQAVHFTPPVPQVVLVLVLQTPTFPGPFEQHPVGQVVALQMQPVPFALQVVPVGQVPQEPPHPFGPHTLP